MAIRPNGGSQKIGQVRNPAGHQTRFSVLRLAIVGVNASGSIEEQSSVAVQERLLRTRIVLFFVDEPRLVQVVDESGGLQARVGVEHGLLAVFRNEIGALLPDQA